jgi:acetyl esterase/lipase
VTKPMPTFEEVVKLRVVHRLPGMEAVTVRRDLPYKSAGEARLEMDVYAPPGLKPGERRPAVVFVHGGPVPPGSKSQQMGVFVSYGELAAACGFVGVTFNHRFDSPQRLVDAAGDVADLLARVRKDAEDLHVDAERLAVWAFSGGGPTLAPLLAERPAWLRAVVAYYAVLDIQTPPPGQPDTLGAEMRRTFSPAAQLGPGPRPLPPILVARAGLDHPLLNAAADRFVQEALGQNAPLALLNHPEGRHGFDILDDDARTHEILASTFEFLKRRLER